MTNHSDHRAGDADAGTGPHYYAAYKKAGRQFINGQITREDLVKYVTPDVAEQISIDERAAARRRREAAQHQADQATRTKAQRPHSWPPSATLSAGRPRATLRAGLPRA
jgi:hypothetical protein